MGYIVYVPIAPTQHTKMWTQIILKINVGHESSPIIIYLEPLIENLFIAYFVDFFFMNKFSNIKRRD